MTSISFYGVLMYGMMYRAKHVTLFVTMIFPALIHTNASIFTFTSGYFDKLVVLSLTETNKLPLSIVVPQVPDVFWRVAKRVDQLKYPIAPNAATNQQLPR